MTSFPSALSSQIWAGAVLVALLAASIFGPRRAAKSKAWLLLRALFPSWRFFEDVGTSGELFYRIQRSEPEPWTPAIDPSERRLGNLFQNPHGNLRFAQQSLIDQLLQELELSTPIEATVPHQLVCNLIRERIQRLGSSRLEDRFEFRILSESHAPEEPVETFYHSGVYPVTTPLRQGGAR
jgi:hypothetical protein